MFCRICGARIPDDSVFCPHCGQKVVLCEAPEPAEAPETGQKSSFDTQVFTYPPNTTYDQASVPVNQWLGENGLRILDARCELDATLLAGTMVPILSRLEIDWVPEETGRHYQLGVMIDSRTDFGLGKQKGSKGLQRQFDRWKGEHPEYEIAGKQDTQMSLGWASAWVTLFFYR